jgi:ABC-type dipeptide/oligopeptide/nickel transport system permease component
MQQLTASLPAILVVAVILAFLVFTAVRVGVRFLVRRLAGLIFILLGVTFITFLLGYFAPGDAVVGQLGVHYTPQAAAELRHFYGLDLPWYQQYGNFLGRLVHFDLGMSYINRDQTVWSILQRGVPVSMQLGLMAILVAVVIGVPLGLVAAVRANTSLDTTVQSLALTFFAIPSFVLIAFFAVAMITLNNNNLPHLPVAGWDWTDPSTVVAPILIASAGAFAVFTRLTRASVIETLRQDYVRTARAKGLDERTVILRHAFRNALIPLITVLGPALASTVNGLFVVELLFNIPGIANQTVTSINQRDWPVLQGTVIVLAVAVAFLNLVADVMYGIADPRIKVA